MVDLNNNSICLLPSSYRYMYVDRPVYPWKLPSPTLCYRRVWICMQNAVEIKMVCILIFKIEPH